MQKYAQNIRDQVWDRLRQIYMRYTNNRQNITPEEIKEIVVREIKETNPTEIDYVMKNLQRLDVDGSGTIDFTEFANFFLKRHCGEIALQRMHIQNRIRNGKDRKITPDEFNALLNNAYEFLGVKVNSSETLQIFRETDKDGDGLITYAEYFKFVDDFILKTKNISITKVGVSPAVPSVTRREFSSRLRRFLWLELRRLYDKYDTNRNDLLEMSEINVLIREILREYSQSDIDYLIFNIFKINPNERTNSITFTEFAPFFINHTAELGLNRFLQQHNKGARKNLSREDFVVLIKTSFNYLPFSRVSDLLLYRLFDKIDTDNDGFISYSQYLDWVRLFLVPRIYYIGSGYQIQDDDELLNIGRTLILSEQDWRREQDRNRVAGGTPTVNHMATVIKAPQSTITSNASQGLVSQTITTLVAPFRFSSLDMAIAVRKKVQQDLLKFDRNGNRLFEEPEIVDILQSLLKENKHEVKYVTLNVFRYDKDGDKKITLDELTNFFLEMHCGEMAIQRLHRNDTYKRGAEKMMNLEEFIKTVRYALSFFSLVPAEEDLGIVFGEVDRNQDGWITYAEYFEFLRYYFGSQSYIAIHGINHIENSRERDINLILNDQSLTLEERLRRLILYQLRWVVWKGDTDINRMLSKAEVLSLLRSHFHYTEQEVAQLLRDRRLNDLESRGMTYEELVSYLTSYHVKGYTLVGFERTYKLSRSREQLINSNQFANLIDFAFAFSSFRPRTSHLEVLFRKIDTDKDGWITYDQAIQALLDILKGKEIKDNAPLPPPPAPYVYNDEQLLYGELWGELKRIFDYYDINRNGYLNESELELLCREVLLEASRKKLNEIATSLLKYNPSTQRNEVKFLEFAPYILNHCGQNALTRFHLQQQAGKNHLTRDEFSLVVRSGFEFLKTISSRSDIISSIYSRLTGGGRTNNMLSYQDYQRWLHLQVKRNPRI